MTVETENIDRKQLLDFFSRVILKKSEMIGYYRLFNIFKKILTENNIDFFAHSGTMLGCVRHQAIIPWDDDLDFMIEELYEEKLLAIVPILELAGIKLKEIKNPGLLQFYNANKDTHPLANYLQIDVFVGKRMEIDQQTCLHYKSDDFRGWFPQRFIRIADLYPLKDYEFGPLQVKGIRNYENYFSNSGFDVKEAIVARHKMVPIRYGKNPYYPIDTTCR